VFRSSDEFYPGDPDYDWMHETVDRALEAHNGSGHHKPKAEEDSKNACAYQPVS
jgi:hypothetical protein